MKKVVLFIATFWAVIWNNSKMLDTIPTRNFLVLVNLPRELRIIEVIAVLLLFLISLYRIKYQYQSKYILLLIIFLMISTMGLLLPGAELSDRFQGIFLYFSPLAFFFICTIIPLSRNDLKYIFKFYSYFVILNIIIGIIIDIPINKEVGDGINGLFSDAHIFGTFLAVWSCLYFYLYFEIKEKKYMVISIFLLIFSFFPSNEKMILFNIIFMVLLSLRNIFHKKFKIWKPRIIIIVLIFSGLTYLGYMKFVEPYEMVTQDGLRINSLVEIGIENLGPIQAWPLAINTISKHVYSLLFGIGSANYGGVAAARALLQGGKYSSISSQFYNQIVTGKGIAGAFITSSNTWTSLLAELGIFGFAIFFYLLFLIIKRVKETNSLEPFDKKIRAFFFILLLSIIYQGLITPYTNLGEPIFVYPLMLSAGYLSQFSLKNKNIISS